MPNLLTWDELRATAGRPWTRIADDQAPQAPVTTYRRSIDPADFDGRTFARSHMSIEGAENGRYAHVLYQAEDERAFLDIVVDVGLRTIVGHCVVDADPKAALQRSGGAGLARR